MRSHAAEAMPAPAGAASAATVTRSSSYRRDGGSRHPVPGFGCSFFPGCVSQVPLASAAPRHRHPDEGRNPSPCLGTSLSLADVRSTFRSPRRRACCISLLAHCAAGAVQTAQPAPKGRSAGCAESREVTKRKGTPMPRSPGILPCDFARGLRGSPTVHPCTDVERAGFQPPPLRADPAPPLRAIGVPVSAHPARPGRSRLRYRFVSRLPFVLRYLRTNGKEGRTRSGCVFGSGSGSGSCACSALDVPTPAAAPRSGAGRRGKANCPRPGMAELFAGRWLASTAGDRADAVRPARLPGSSFLWLLSFDETKESNPLAAEASGTRGSKHPSESEEPKPGAGCLPKPE